MKIYSGKRNRDGIGGAYVQVNHEGRISPLGSSNHIVNHSPDGFNWGYYGSGPSQLALSILLDLYGEDIARKYYQYFKQSFVGTWGEEFFITSEEIDEWLEKVVLTNG